MPIDTLHRPPVEPWLVKFTDALTIPALVTYDFLVQLGIDALIAKQKSVELTNLGRTQRTMKRVPERLDFDEIAALLLETLTFRMIATSHQSDDALLGLYVPSDDDIWQKSKEMTSAKGTYTTNIQFFNYVVSLISPKSKTRDIEEILERIRTFAPNVRATTDVHLFPVENGIYDQKWNVLHDFSERYVYLTKIAVDYVPGAVNPVITNPDNTTWDVETWLRELSVSDDVETLLWQVISAALQPNRGMNKSIWFYSESGNNGKGTVGQLIKNLLGRGNYAPLSVSDFKHEFLKQSLIGVAANISDENDVDEYIDSVKDYKASVTGDDILINRKHKDPVRVQFRGLNIQMMNGLPKTRDKTGSFYRRLIIVPFIKSFTNNGERQYIKSDYINRRDVLEYVLQKALQLTFDEFIVPSASKHLIEQYREKNNPVLDFWNELKGEFKWDLIPRQFLYDVYQKWFERTNPSGKMIGQRTFFDHLSPIIDADPAWKNHINSDASNVRSDKLMADDEPLISLYGLDQPYRNGSPTPWMSRTYRGTNPQKKRQFDRSSKYRGIVRV